MKKIIIALVAMLFLLPSCDKALTEEPMEPETEQPTDPVEPEKPEEPEQPAVKPKPVLLWVDASANFMRLRTKPNIRKYLDIAQENGFNGICLDVKPIRGEALYHSSFLKPCEKLGGYEIRRDWDYLQFFIEEAHKRNMTVIASACIMTWGAIEMKEGPAFEDPALKGKWCIEYLPEGLRPIIESKDSGIFCFMNPLYPEVQEYIKKMVTEIVTNYDIDGFIMDYCRYQNLNSDFSDLSRKEFEKYSGLVCEDFPNDIYYYNPGADKDNFTPGKYFNQWIEWRSHVIQQTVTMISKTVHSIKPEVSVQLWGASWWPLWGTGQNWASPKTDRTGSYWWSTPNYYKTGFADQLDVFQLGAYMTKLESIASAINTANVIIEGDCQCYGTISAAVPKNFKMAEVCELCLKETDGLMVFELSHIENNDFWPDIKAGVEKAEKDLGITR